MARHDLDWISCPDCDAGSPAGVSTCPRCRYQFPIHAGPETSEFELSPPPGGPPHKRRSAEGSAVRDLLVGALCAVLATAGAGAVQGAIVRLKVCSATADALSSAIFVMVVYVVRFGVPASVIGAILGWVLGRLGAYASRSRAAKPILGTDDLAEP